jgi:hypothetical protein
MNKNSLFLTSLRSEIPFVQFLLIREDNPLLSFLKFSAHQKLSFMQMRIPHMLITPRFPPLLWTSDKHGRNTDAKTP